MAQVSPIIQNGILTDLRDGPPVQIVLESSDWYAWLQYAQVFVYSNRTILHSCRRPEYHPANPHVQPH